MNDLWDWMAEHWESLLLVVAWLSVAAVFVFAFLPRFA